ncbi:unnamed protein product [Protopolystoma xenopodis]|uniref:Innexin n=1 Tax=Protopolystoma xenopodis TaxID=117903 RepID=A0A3S4ZVR7_9PLAT|nr:unnamed protein product [Protopolystoma xenopodis]
MFGLQAVLFYLPRIAWQSVSHHRLGLDFRGLAFAARRAVSERLVKDRRKKTKLIAKNILLLLSLHHQPPSGKSSSQRLLWTPLTFWPSKWRGTWIFFAFVCIKLIYLANSVFQLSLMHVFLGLREAPWLLGLTLFSNAFFRIHRKESLYFPLTTVCTVSLHHLGTLDNQYTGTCVLPMNLFNEKLFLALFAWIYFVTIATALSLLWWLWRMLQQERHKQFILRLLLTDRANRLKMNRLDRLKGSKRAELEMTTPEANTSDDKNEDEEKEKIKKELEWRMLKGPLAEDEIDEFVTNLLSIDGVMLFRVLILQYGLATTSEIINFLWKFYHIQIKQTKKPSTPETASLTTSVPSLPELLK